LQKFEKKLAELNPSTKNTLAVELNLSC